MHNMEKKGNRSVYGYPFIVKNSKILVFLLVKIYDVNSKELNR